MMSIGREIAWELHAYIIEHGLDGAGWFIITRDSTVHATETRGNARMNPSESEWPSSILHALSMRTANLHLIKSRSAVRRFTHNLQIVNFLKY